MDKNSYGNIYNSITFIINLDTYLFFFQTLGKSQHSDLTTVLNELAEDVRHGGPDIYNPFTPVISPLEGPPSRIDKLYIQTSSGYRPVDNNNFYKSSLDIEADENRFVPFFVKKE